MIALKDLAAEYAKKLDETEFGRLVEILGSCPSLNGEILLDKIDGVSYWLPVKAPRMVAQTYWAASEEGDIAMVRFSKETEAKIAQALDILARGE